MSNLRVAYITVIIFVVLLAISTTVGAQPAWPLPAIIAAIIGLQLTGRKRHP
jgi:hypothetical protein